MDRDYYFAVFGDIHGRIALMYTLASLWQTEQKVLLDGLLQVGDMGAFPYPDKLDKATYKHAKNDTDELGFSNFCRRTEESKLYFEDQNSVKTYFIRGNHEDFDYLSSFSIPTGIDPWNNIWYIPDGQYINLGNFEDKLYLAGFGGIAPKDNDRHRGKQHRKAHRRGKNKSIKDPKFFTSKDINMAFNNIPPVDILMTHGAPYTVKSPFGSKIISNLSERLQPRIHFFGHHHVTLEPCEIESNRLLVGLEHLEFKNNGQLKEGAWGILKMNSKITQFSFCSSEKMQWLSKVTQESYRFLWNGS